MPEVRLIDAIELVRYLCGACPSHQNGECIDKMCWKYEDRARIENAPTIEAEPVRHGRWVPITNDDFGFASKFKCSYCNDIIRLSVAINECHYNYCPNCGAKMDGGADNG